METEVAEDFEDGTEDVGEAGEEEDFRLLIRRYIKWLTLLEVMHSNPIVNNSKEWVYLWSVTEAVRLEISKFSLENHFMRLLEVVLVKFCDRLSF